MRLLPVRINFPNIYATPNAFNELFNIKTSQIDYYAFFFDMAMHPPCLIPNSYCMILTKRYFIQKQR